MSPSNCLVTIAPLRSYLWATNNNGRTVNRAAGGCAQAIMSSLLPSPFPVLAIYLKALSAPTSLAVQQITPSEGRDLDEDTIYYSSQYLRNIFLLTTYLDHTRTAQWNVSRNNVSVPGVLRRDQPFHRTLFRYTIST